MKAINRVVLVASPSTTCARRLTIEVSVVGTGQLDLPSYIKGA
ncbi:MAG: hypothetical protein A4E63_01253 [Syntrophorhabdus sp. PtaU1.Bin050]|nr:MAG: hypothetical protein A4E63_01253 [Syntrophorhabdus sp. PtaU1.Bin050]